jgi:drug/metabolite transporter (DMT)-like permease
MIGFAGRDLATRAAPKSMTTAQLGVYGFIMLSIAGGIVWGYQGGVAPLGGGGMVLTGPAILFGVAAYMCLTMAMRTGQIAVIAPFRYTRLVFAMILAVAVFGERPDALTLIGSLIIVASGLYTVWQSRRI